MIIHFWGCFLPILPPPWGLEFLEYCHIKLTPSIHPWTMGPAQKWSLFFNFSHADWFFLARGHFGHFQCSLGPFNRGEQPLGAPQRPPEVIDILRYAYHNHKIPPPQKNSCLLFLGHLKGASSHLYKRVCVTVRLSVGPSVCNAFGHAFGHAFVKNDQNWELQVNIGCILASL